MDSTDDKTWMKKANCRGIDPGLLFEGFEEATIAERLEVVKLCVDCEVSNQCGAYAESFPYSEGIHNGLFYRMGKPKDPFKVRKPARAKVAA